jgi:ABC-type transport system involved in cytochrome c biogenesis permease component
MKAKEQLLDFINYALMIAVIGVSIIFFTIPGNFERFQSLLKALAPIVLFLGVMMARFRYFTKELKESNMDDTDELDISLTYWDRMRLEFVLTGLPVVLLIWNLIRGDDDWSVIGQPFLVFVVNYLVLRFIFKRNP